MNMVVYALIGGIWLSLLYSAAVLPATVHSIQVTISRGWSKAAQVSCGLALGQLPWSLFASAILFDNARIWIAMDLPMRIAAVLFLLWMAQRTARAQEIRSLLTPAGDCLDRPIRVNFWRSVRMPWRLPLWLCIILSVGVHLRGPGMQMALIFCLGTACGQLLWLMHFITVAAVFGHRVPEEITLRSMNKLRFLSIVVLLGLTLIILAPIAFPPS